MKYSYQNVNINPNFPCGTVGFGNRFSKIKKVRLSLNMRILRLVDEKQDVMLISIDSLYVSYDVYQLFKQLVNRYFPDCKLIISASHTHYAPSLANQFPLLKVNRKYRQFVLQRLEESLKSMELQEIDGYLDYHYTPFTQMGLSRLTNNNDNDDIYAGVLSLFDGQKRLGSILFYNCHPTIDVKKPKYFSSEYIGYCYQLLEQEHPDEFFMFLQGADGDVSTRYSRKERSFDELTRMAGLLSVAFDQQLLQNQPLKPLTLECQQKLYDFDFAVKTRRDIPEAFLQKARTNRDASSMRIIRMLSILQYLPLLPKKEKICLSIVNLGPYCLFFSPYELFCSYNELIDKNTTLLVGYSNGALAYLTPLANQGFSYESLLETTSDQDKKIIIDSITRKELV